MTTTTVSITRTTVSKRLLKKVEDVKAKLKLIFEKGGFSIEFKVIHPNLKDIIVVFSVQRSCPLLSSGRAMVNLYWFISAAPFLAFHSINPICTWLASSVSMRVISPYADGSSLSPDYPAYLTNKCVVCNSNVNGGKTVFARDVIEAGELIGVWSGRIVMGNELAGIPEEIKHHVVQVGEDQYLAYGTPNDAPDFINHSCEPNAGMDSEVTIVALRHIFPGEEVSIDYAMCDGSAYDEFDCMCGSRLCRGRVSGEDWHKPALWKRYAKHFSPYLLRRIQALKQVRVARVVHTVGAVSVPHAPAPCVRARMFE